MADSQKQEPDAQASNKEAQGGGPSGKKGSPIGVIIASTGSPVAPEPEAVKEYLQRFLMDARVRQVPVVPWWFILHCAILPKRKFASAERYKRVWTPEGSPLESTQAKLASAIQDLFDTESVDEKAANPANPANPANDAAASVPADAAGADAEKTKTHVLVRSASIYSEPSMEKVIAELKAAECARLVLVPLYPQSAYSCTLSVKDGFDCALKSSGWNVPVSFIDHYCEEPLYLDAIAQSVRDAGFGQSEADTLVMSYHSIPLKDERAGDTYRTQTQNTTRAVAQRLEVPADQVAIGLEACAGQNVRVAHGYQCVFGGHPEAWLSPLSVDILSQWRGSGRHVFFCCPGFAIDCLETLDDIPNEIAPLYVGDGTARAEFTAIPCLNATDDNVKALYQVIQAKLKEENHVQR